MGRGGKWPERFIPFHPCENIGPPKPRWERMIWAMCCPVSSPAAPSSHHRYYACLPWGSAVAHFSSKPFAWLLTVYSSEIKRFLTPLTWLQANQYFFLYLHLIFCCFHSSAICTCDKVKWGLNVTWDFLPLSCSFLSFSFDICQLNYVVKKGKWGSLYPLFWLPTVHPNLIFYFVVCYI